jgi:uncharacterized OB-fold protein
MPELSPGSVGRRWIPEGGIQNHRDKIHRDSKFADDNKNLPFTFSKPRRTTRSIVVRCKNCGYVTSVSKNTVGMICVQCEKYSNVEEITEDMEGTLNDGGEK